MKIYNLSVSSINIFYNINLDDFKLTGLEQEPKGICKDKVVGTWKVVNMEVIVDQ